MGALNAPEPSARFNVLGALVDNAVDVDMVTGMVIEPLPVSVIVMFAVPLVTGEIRSVVGVGLETIATDWLLLVTVYIGNPPLISKLALPFKAIVTPVLGALVDRGVAAATITSIVTEAPSLS